MPVNQYPAFEGGQTLTAADLNDVREFLHHRDRQLGRMIGFGINCGLGGAISGSTLTVGPGLAVDQTGEPLVLGAATTVALPPAATGGTFDFVNAASGGFSVVLESTDTVQLPPDCGQADCDQHAEQHTRAVAVRVVAGRVTGPRFEFAAEPLLAVSPMQLSITSNPQGSFVTLRNALTARLNGKINSTLLATLGGIAIDASDLPGEKGYKAGFINQVLFAALDLLRCESLMAISCNRSTARPGVVLGWLELVSGTWHWRCQYRHAWEPPTGLAHALLGGTCSDPCKISRDALEALIAGYVEPQPPATPPTGGVDPDIFEFCPKGAIRVDGRCTFVYEPPVVLPDKWAIPWEYDPLGPIWNPPIETDPWIVYERDELDFMGSGVINVAPAWGLDAGGVESALGTKITDLGGSPNIVLVGQGELAGLGGYAPASAASPADTIVLVQDTSGRVVATGRVPAAHTARMIGTELPAASAKAEEALGATQGLALDVAQLGGELAGVQEDIGAFEQFRIETGTWRSGIDQAVAGVDTRIDEVFADKYGTQMTDMERRMATMEGSVEILKVRAVRDVATPGATGGLAVNQEFAAGMIEYAETLTQGLTTLVNADNEDRLGRYVRDASRAASKLEMAVAESDPLAVQAAALEVLDTMRTAIKSAGIAPEMATQVDAQFRMMRDIAR